MCPDHPSVQDGWGAAPEGSGQLSPPGRAPDRSARGDAY